MPRNRLHQIVPTLLKLVVTGALVYWLLASADFAAIGVMLERLGAGLLLGAIAVQLTGSFLTALRWWLLLRHTGAQANFGQVLPSYYLGLFFNNLLPTGVGGDVVRALHLNRRGFDLRALAASVVMDRAIGLLVMLLVASACAVFFSTAGLDAAARRSALALLIVVLAATVFAFSPAAGRLLGWLQQQHRRTRIRLGILDSALLCYSYRTKPSLLLTAALLSLLAQSLAILTYIMLGTGIGLTLPPVSYFIIIPIVFIAAMLPISLGGLGVREGALVALLIAFGADQQLAIGLSLLYLFVLWLSTLPGAAVLLVQGNSNTPS